MTRAVDELFNENASLALDRKDMTSWSDLDSDLLACVFPTGGFELPMIHPAMPRRLRR